MNGLPPQQGCFTEADLQQFLLEVQASYLKNLLDPALNEPSDNISSQQVTDLLAMSDPRSQAGSDSDGEKMLTITKQNAHVCSLHSPQKKRSLLKQQISIPGKRCLTVWIFLFFEYLG
jgi:hypothetical protein